MPPPGITAMRPARSWPAGRYTVASDVITAFPVCRCPVDYAGRSRDRNGTLGAKVLASRDFRCCILPGVPA
jgi:hypothetical protein